MPILLAANLFIRIDISQSNAQKLTIDLLTEENFNDSIGFSNFSVGIIIREDKSEAKWKTTSNWYFASYRSNDSNDFLIGRLHYIFHHQTLLTSWLTAFDALGEAFVSAF